MKSIVSSSKLSALQHIIFAVRIQKGAKFSAKGYAIRVQCSNCLFMIYYFGPSTSSPNLRKPRSRTKIYTSSMDAYLSVISHDENKPRLSDFYSQPALYLITEKGFNLNCGVKVERDYIHLIVKRITRTGGKRSRDVTTLKGIKWGVTISTIERGL